MKKFRYGYTLVEVLLFLAITGLLFVGIIAGTGNSITQQRFFDAVQSFAEFMRSTYSQVSNVQSVGNGMSDEAIYGRMISFGQRYELNGSEIPGGEQRVFTYDVVGGIADNTGSGTVMSILAAVDARVNPEGLSESYTPRWGSVIRNTEGELFTGTILVVRHPRSGTINTIYSSEVVNVNQGGAEEVAIPLSSFGAGELDFCIDPEGMTGSELQRDVRLVKNARNASGLEIIELDLNKVERINDVLVQMGNRCRFGTE